MKKLTLLLFLIFLNFYSSGQNLVSNPSFETTNCSFGHITLFGYCDWIVPPADGNTPDGFKDSSGICFPCSCLPGQNTFAGDTYSPYGQYFVGIMGYYNQGGQVNAREYIHQQLASPLIAGQTYQMGFSIKFGSRSKYLIDHLGMFVSDSAYGPTNTSPLFDLIDVNPQIDLSGQLFDSTNWTTLSTTYTAIGGEKYVTIGNFTPDSLLMLSINPTFNPTDTTCLLAINASYFFIDSVFIVNTMATYIIEGQESNIKIYPNPFSSSTTIEFQNNFKNADLDLYNYLGSKVKIINHISEDRIIVIRGNLPSGIYFVRLTEGNKTITTSKLIITN
jgi:OmpA-OmpF porin, OOP family